MEKNEEDRTRPVPSCLPSVALDCLQFGAIGSAAALALARVLAFASVVAALAAALAFAGVLAFTGVLVGLWLIETGGRRQAQGARNTSRV
jgi:hypothetical protein